MKVSAADTARFISGEALQYALDELESPSECTDEKENYSLKVNPGRLQ